jgi:NADH dehydrogenase FAD-containing subunit
MTKPWRVVIVGGALVASELSDVTLIGRRNYHLFQPLLYQVATGSLSPRRNRRASVISSTPLAQLIR